MSARPIYTRPPDLFFEREREREKESTIAAAKREKM
jgi:hypothetical protein